MIVPVSAVIATRNRGDLCRGLIAQIQNQEAKPVEIIVCDASDAFEPIVDSSVLHLKATVRGAAPQRNEAIAASTQPSVLFLDDDITLEPGCIRSLWSVMEARPDAGAVTATSVNEAYAPPGVLTRSLLRWFEGGRERSGYAGACVGPGMTFLPADDERAPDAVAVEWMATTCALYRRELLPHPPFADFFQGASSCEDLALSLAVGKRAPLLQASRARFHHHCAGGDHKRDVQKLASMNLLNRHYVMTRVMEKRSARDHLQLAVMLLFGVAGLLRQGRVGTALQWLAGYGRGAVQLFLQR